MRGIPKGGLRPPLCRRGGGIHKGGTPSKGSLPYAPLSAQDGYCLLFRRGKSTPGSGGGAPENPRGTGPEAPKQPKDLRFAAEASWCVLCVF